jgi:hypothetical protein
MAHIYLSSPAVSCRFSRAARALCLTDFDLAWKALGKIAEQSGIQISRRFEDGQTIINAFGKEFTLQEFIKDENVRKSIPHPTSEENSGLQQAFHAIAYSEWEAQKSATALCQIFSVASGKTRLPTQTKTEPLEKLRELVGKIPGERPKEIAYENKICMPARRELLNNPTEENAYLLEAILKSCAERRSATIMFPEAFVDNGRGLKAA